jgi:predicted membrane metal-binding protein
VFLRLPYNNFAISIQHIVLVSNTILLIVGLIAFEVLRSETPIKNRKSLGRLYPLIAISVCILAYAVYKQVKA